MSASAERKKLKKVWKAMIRRCSDPADKSYENYGGRGITVCEEWLDFNVFLSDMGPRPDGMTLERRDNNCGYSASNCRWESRKAQCRNKRSNRLITYQGETMCLLDWGNRLGFSDSFLRRRMDVQKMSFEEAITKSKRYKVWRRSLNQNQLRESL